MSTIKAMTIVEATQKWLQRAWLSARAPIAGRLAVALVLIPTLGQLDAIGEAQGASADGGVNLRGAGSTFAAPLYKKWIEEYAVSHPNIALSYDLL